MLFRNSDLFCASKMNCSEKMSRFMREFTSHGREFWAPRIRRRGVYVFVHSFWVSADNDSVSLHFMIALICLTSRITRRCSLHWSFRVERAVDNVPLEFPTVTDPRRPPLLPTVSNLKQPAVSPIAQVLAAPSPLSRALRRTMLRLNFDR